MVEVGIALVATLAALAGTGALLSRAAGLRRPHLFAWALTQLGLCVGLGAMSVGLLVGFNAPLFRAMEIGGALIAPVWLAMGVVEIVTRAVPVRFAARLVVVSYTIVAVVILALDPLRGTLSTDLPEADQHYEWLPQAVIAGAHLIAVTTLVICAAVTALRARDLGRAGATVLVPVALIALAGVLIVSAVQGFLPGAAGVFALGAASALIWFGAVKTIPVRSDDGYDDGYGDGYDGYDDFDGYEDNDPAYDGRPRHRRAQMPADPAAAAMAGPPLSAPVPPTPPAMSPPMSPPLSPSLPGRPAPSGPQVPSGPAMEIPAGAYGQITVYTLLDGRESAFDRLSRDAVRAARQSDPGTIIYACHEVVGAPTQRIFYQLFRDQAAFQEHQNRPYVRQFLTDSRSHVIATNVIELRLDAAKVMPAAPPTGPELQMGRPWGP
jgi:quinol monooxygenase YgiN